MKRLFDILFSFVCLLVFAMPLIVIALLVRRKLGSPVFFSQIRPGMHCKPFKMIKFRTMLDKRSTDGQLLPDSARLTPFGVFLRSTSLDELPELWNVLKGDMSFVGPRPLLMQYLPLFSSEQVRRHDVRPGITGWAQINGRNAISWEEKFRLDVWYVDHQSFWLDFSILLITTWKVIRREGISGPGEATMSPFAGTSAQQ
jgi:lipopolysaccharide/colanic/teichoic acid biosynthesis glycosyltransferase